MSESFIAAFGRALGSPIDNAMKALLLTLPSEESLADRQAQTGKVDVHGIRHAREQVKAAWRLVMKGNGRLFSTIMKQALTEPMGCR